MALVLCLPACGDDKGDTHDQGNQGASGAGDGIGALVVTIAAGEGVAGLAPGPDIGNLVDGWTVSHEQLLVTLGDVTATAGSSREPESLTYSAVYIVDLTQLPAAGSRLTYLADQPAMSFDSTAFATPIANERAELVEQVTEDDRAFLVKNSLNLRIRGTMTNPSGQSCNLTGLKDCAPAPTIRFDWSLSVPTRFSSCDGFTLSDSESTELIITLPGDHWFLTSFAAEAERSHRRAQWIADADLDRDGVTTLDELRNIKAAALFTPELGYDLASAPIAVDTAYDFLAAQARTLGRNSATGCTLGEPLD